MKSRIQSKNALMRVLVCVKGKVGCWSCSLDHWANYPIRIDTKPLNEQRSWTSNVNYIKIQSIEQNKVEKHRNTSIGVIIFFSLILSYFCFLVLAFSPCQGRLTEKAHKKNIRTEKSKSLTHKRRDKIKKKKFLCFQPSAEEIH